MNSALKTATSSVVDRSRLLAVIEPIAHAHGAEVVDVEFKTESGGWVLRVFIEKAGSSESLATVRDAAVTLELCALVARDLSPALDVADLIAQAYNLEVSSPGVERPLKTARDFQRFSGQKAKLKLLAPVQGQKVLRGTIGTKEGGTLTVVQDSRTYDIALDNIERAHLVFEFGPAPKPGGASTGRRK